MTHPKYKKWKWLSGKIATWLMANLSANIAEAVAHSDHPQEYAHEMYDAIKEVVVGSGPMQYATAIKKLYKLRRSDYGTVK